MTGIDIVKIDRIEKLLERHREKALRRFLHEEEIVLAKSAESVAGLYAAKEAVAKALGHGISATCGFHDIKIHKDQNGAPYFTLKREIVERFQIKSCDLSITHDGGFAIAVVFIQSTHSFKREICH
ncbi:MAG: holo-ACP synthase [Sulfurospirillum sp.]|nr:MAG: holo-ACP synthase [Sulfurospirillum sp.]